jgi:hypothetical protein
LLAPCSAWAAPSIEVNPTSVDFSPPDFMVGVGSPEQKVLIANLGTDPLKLTSITIRGSDPVDFTLSGGGCPAVLQPQEQCEKFVGFRPQAAGSRSAQLVIASDDPQRAVLLVPLTGAAILPAPRLTVSAGEMDFGTQPVNAASDAQYVMATNIGMRLLHFTNVGISPAGEFSLVPPIDCGSVDLAPLSSGLIPWWCYAYIAFKPSGPGLRTATLTFESNDPNGPATVALRGTGAGPSISLSPSPLNFGSREVGMSGNTRYVELTNTGTAPLQLTDTPITGGQAGDFTAISGSTCTVQPQGVCRIAIGFTPRASGTRLAELVVNSNTSQARVPMQGFGEFVAPPPPPPLTADDHSFLSSPTTPMPAGCVGNPSQFRLDFQVTRAVGMLLPNGTLAGAPAAIASRALSPVATLELMNQRVEPGSLRPSGGSSKCVPVRLSVTC